MKIATIILSVVILLSSIYIRINSAEISAYAISENMQKPVIVYENNLPVIKEESITYLIYALDGEKLHNPPFTENYPQIEVSVSDKLFTSYIVDGEVQTYAGKASDPDLQIRLQDTTLTKILLADDPKLALKEAIKERLVGVTIYSDKTELLLKGYLELYDSLKA